MKARISLFLGLLIFRLIEVIDTFSMWLDDRATALQQYGCRHEYVFHTVFFDDISLQYIDYWNCRECDLTRSTAVDKDNIRSISGEKVTVSDDTPTVVGVDVGIEKDSSFLIMIVDGVNYHLPL